MSTSYTKIQPLIEDLGRIVQGEFLTSTHYKRWLVEKNIDNEWSQYIGIVRENRSFVMIGYDHDAADAKDALGYMVTGIYEQKREKLPNFLHDLLSFYADDQSVFVDASEIEKDLLAIGYNKGEVSVLDNISATKPIEKRIQEKQTIEMAKTATNTPKTPLVFISHSHGDEAFVVALVNLLEDVGFTKDTLFCSSVREYGIPLSGDIFETIRELFLEHDLYVIFVHSPRFYGSAVSLNEMGAAWVLKTDFCSFLTNDMEYGLMKGVVNNAKLSIKVNEKEAPSLLNDLYKHLVAVFSLQELDINKWEHKRDQFLSAVRNLKNEVVENTVEENNVDVEYKKLQIEKMKAEADSRLKASIRGNIIRGFRGGASTLKIFNAGASQARNVRVEWLNEDDNVILSSDFSEIGELTPQNSRSYTLHLAIGHPETMNLRYIWDDDFAVGNTVEESLQL